MDRDGMAGREKSQLNRFKEAARGSDTDDNEDRFNKQLKQLARHEARRRADHVERTRELGQSVSDQIKKNETAIKEAKRSTGDE